VTASERIRAQREAQSANTADVREVKGNNEFQIGYDDGYGKRLLDPAKGGPKYAAGYLLGCEHRLDDDNRADPHWPSDYNS
jgi:hypothetical protein